MAFACTKVGWAKFSFAIPCSSLASSPRFENEASRSTTDSSAGAAVWSSSPCFRFIAGFEVEVEVEMEMEVKFCGEASLGYFFIGR